MAGLQAVILFHSSNYAMRAEKVLNDIGITGKLIPVPRHLSSDCGLCLQIRQEDKEKALAHLDKQKVAYQACHDMY